MFTTVTRSPRSWLIRGVFVGSLMGCSTQGDGASDRPAVVSGSQSTGSPASTAGSASSVMPPTGALPSDDGAGTGGVNGSGSSSASSAAMSNSLGHGGTSSAPAAGGMNGSGSSSASSAAMSSSLGEGGAGASSGGVPAGANSETGGANGSSSSSLGGAGNSTAGGADAGGANGAAAGTSAAGGAPALADGVDPKFLIFLLLGQSNMVGQPQPESQDRVEDPRIKVLAYDNCSNVGRQYNQWYTASPPLHQCDAGVGPGDYFAKTLLEALPEDYSIGLVPLAVNGAPIDVFRKGVPRPGWTLPPDDHWETGYEFIVSRANEAQKVGVIRGLLFHQGESNSEAPEWPGQVAQLVTDLRADLGIGDVPFLAGELYYEGCCKAHNALIAQLTDSVENGFLISAEGLGGFDQYHFDLAGQREFGRRYGETMQGALMLP